MSTNCRGSFGNVAPLTAINFYERLNERLYKASTVDTKRDRKLSKQTNKMTEKNKYDESNELSASSNKNNVYEKNRTA